MSRVISTAVVIVAVLLAVTGCAAAPALSTDESLTYDSRGDYAGIFGTAHTEIADGGLCVSVESESGIGRGRVNLVFPAGYSATAAGQVRDPRGVEVLSDGDRVAVSVAPKLISTLPAGCSSAGAGTANALHIDPLN